MAILQAFKSANQEFVFMTNNPEKLTYTIILKNESDCPYQNIIVTDVIGFGAVYIPNTFSLNGINIPGANPNCGVDIGNLAKGKMAIVTFDIEICPQCPPEYIDNFATITYTDCCDNTSVSIDTNIVRTKLVHVCVKLSKNVDKCVANKNDILNYSILVENESNIPIENVILYDVLPMELELIPQSILINGNKFIGPIDQGIKLGTLGAGGMIIVVFKAIIECIPQCSNIENMATITFDYSIQLEDNVLTSSGTQNSNSVSTSVGPNSFKQFMISSKLPIPCSNYGVCEIVNKYVDVEITNTEVINTIKGVSCEGENLTGTKIVVNGTLIERIEYIELCSDKTIKVAEYNIRFNTFIVLPENCNDTDNLKIDSFIEDIDMRLIDCNTLYQSVSLLLEVVY
ncbi:hypothetical protein [Paraclostridium dentum]|uniref:hypothetical protein n=1 Tax=Paraclostridium dentum TaxID=2662455 RepID=UPI003F3224BD